MCKISENQLNTRYGELRIGNSESAGNTIDVAILHYVISTLFRLNGGGLLGG